MYLKEAFKILIHQILLVLFISTTLFPGFFSQLSKDKQDIEITELMEDFAEAEEVPESEKKEGKSGQSKFIEEEYIYLESSVSFENSLNAIKFHNAEQIGVTSDYIKSIYNPPKA